MSQALKGDVNKKDDYDSVCQQVEIGMEIDYWGVTVAVIECNT